MDIVERTETKTLGVRYRTPASELSKTMGPIYGEIAAHMAKNGIPFAGPPYARYFNMDMNDLDLEIGFPIAAPAAGAGRVAAGTLPGGAYATATHTGPYETIESTYNALMAFIGERKLECGSDMFEEYLNSPEDTPPEKLETAIYFPLKAV